MENFVLHYTGKSILDGGIHMKLIVCENYDEMSLEGAKIIAENQDTVDEMKQKAKEAGEKIKEAVQDLTKAGDLIRSRTYEAFFPLIAVALIYFAITWGVAGLLGILKRKAEPKRRKNKNILKGVVR